MEGRNKMIQNFSKNWYKLIVVGAVVAFLSTAALAQHTPGFNKKISNKDGSVDIYFGPNSPKGKEANWIQTISNKGWFCLLRLQPKLGLMAPR